MFTSCYIFFFYLITERKVVHQIMFSRGFNKIKMALVERVHLSAILINMLSNHRGKLLRNIYLLGLLLFRYYTMFCSYCEIHTPRV